MTHSKDDKEIQKKASARRRIHTRSLPGHYLGLVIRPNESYEFEPDPNDKGSKPTKEFDPKRIKD